jgi:hypothetical protein
VVLVLVPALAAVLVMEAAHVAAGKREEEDVMTKMVSGIAYLAGWALGFLKAHVTPGLDIVTALEAMGNGLLKATPQKK